MTPLDTNAEAYVVAAFRWAMRDDRFDEVRKCVNRLRTSGEVLAALQVCRDLAAVLERRHHEIATQMLSDLEAGMVAPTPDVLLDDVGDGFAINGRAVMVEKPEKILVLHIEVPGVYADDLADSAANYADGEEPTPRDYLEVVTEEWMREEVGLTIVTLPGEKSTNDDFEVHAYTGRIVGAEARDGRQ